MGLLDWFSGDSSPSEATDPDKRKRVTVVPAKQPVINYYTPTAAQQPQAAPAAQQYAPLKPLPYPTAQDAEDARQYKEKYGDPDTQMIRGTTPLNPNDERQSYRRPTATEMAVVPGWQASKVSAGLLAPPTPTPIDQASADKLMAEQIAARQSPLPYLGFDRDKIAPTINDEDPTGQHFGHYMVTNGPFSQLLGTYVPSKDQMWTDLRDKDSRGFTVHESTHRGFEMLRQAGAPPLSLDDEEVMVRALQLKHFGNIEGGNSPHIDEARERMKDPKFMAKLNDYERRANEMIAKRNLQRGPM